MMLDLPTLLNKYKMQVHGILHVGAHFAEEAQTYVDYGLEPVTWVEANPKLIGRIKNNTYPFGHRVIEALVYSADDVELDFHVTNQDGMSSSLLDLGTHKQFSPETVYIEHVPMRTVTIDTLVARHNIDANFLVMDIQGAELHALQGATKLVKDLQYVMMEVNTADVYVGCAQLAELDTFLSEFRRVETYMVPNQGWGDALWIRL